MTKFLVIHTDHEDIFTVDENVFEIVEKYLRKGKGVKSPDNDWYERERNYNPDTLQPKSGYHVLKYPKGKSPFKNIGSWELFKKKIPTIWNPSKFKEVPIGNATKGASS